MPEKIKYIKQGYKQFRQKYFTTNSHLYEELKERQNPKILVIACSDSRVDPAIILNCKPGDLFVIRNVANLVPPCENDDGHHGTSSALEFGILSLNIKHIVILGHSNCGGIQALIEGEKSIREGRSFISKWMEIAKPALDKSSSLINYQNKEEKLANCAKFALINSFNNLFTFSWIKQKVLTKELFIHIWYFNIETGIIDEFDQQEEKFKPLQID